MFGYLRFFLAYLVLLSHIQISFYSLNIGVFAVVMFYILAGYVVSNLYLNILSDTKNKTFAFYKDRIKRIYPLYLYTTVLYFIFLFLTSYGEPIYTFTNVISEFLIIPLNYYMYLDLTILQNPQRYINSPTWSLGAELQAYILLSFIFLFRKLKYILAAITLVIYTLANLEYLHPDYFGYRFLAGVFFIFLVGSSLQKIKSNKCEDYFDKYFPLFIWFFALVSLFSIYFLSSFPIGYTKETLLGLIVGIPVIYFLSKTNIKLKYNTLLGNLSYGIFLSHFLAIWILDYYSYPANSPYYILYVSLISIFIAVIGVLFIEKKSNF